MSHGYSVAQTARLVCALRWVCGRLSEMLGAWAEQPASAGTGRAEGVDSAAGAARMAELSRLLASHREAFDGVQPDSELMAPWKQAAPASPGLARALDGIAALEGRSERFGVVVAVIAPQLRDACREVCEHAAPHCDAALASAARALGHDLDAVSLRSSDERSLIGGLEGGETAEFAPSAAVEAAERLLAAAGGVVGPSVLRPGARSEESSKVVSKEARN